MKGSSSSLKSHVSLLKAPVQKVRGKTRGLAGQRVVNDEDSQQETSQSAESKRPTNILQQAKGGEQRMTSAAWRQPRAEGQTRAAHVCLKFLINELSLNRQACWGPCLSSAYSSANKTCLVPAPSKGKSIISGLTARFRNHPELH